MRNLIVTYTPWLLSVLTVTTYWAIGNRAWWCWHLGLFTQGVWFIWIPLSGVWGLLPTAIFLTLVQTRNAIKWQRER